MQLMRVEYRRCMISQNTTIITLHRLHKQVNEIIKQLGNSEQAQHLRELEQMVQTSYIKHKPTGLQHMLSFVIAARNKSMRV